MSENENTYKRTTASGFTLTCKQDCERCKTDDFIPHYNCMYQGQKNGHSEGHCTANACY